MMAGTDRELVFLSKFLDTTLWSHYDSGGTDRIISNVTTVVRHNSVAPMSFPS